jgi:hypothetical protein
MVNDGLWQEIEYCDDYYVDCCDYSTVKLALDLSALAEPEDL